MGQKTNSKMVDLNLTISIITLFNVYILQLNGRDRLNKKKKDPTLQPARNSLYNEKE